jgi:hypothetical protein
MDSVTADQGLEDAYIAAWTEWWSGGAEAWDAVIGDGMAE